MTRRKHNSIEGSKIMAITFVGGRSRMYTAFRFFRFKGQIKVDAFLATIRANGPDTPQDVAEAVMERTGHKNILLFDNASIELMLQGRDRGRGADPYVFEDGQEVYATGFRVNEDEILVQRVMFEDVCERNQAMLKKWEKERKTS